MAHCSIRLCRPVVGWRSAPSGCAGPSSDGALLHPAVPARRRTALCSMRPRTNQRPDGASAHPPLKTEAATRQHFGCVTDVPTGGNSLLPPVGYGDAQPNQVHTVRPANPADRDGPSETAAPKGDCAAPRGARTPETSSPAFFFVSRVHFHRERPVGYTGDRPYFSQGLPPCSVPSFARSRSSPFRSPQAASIRQEWRPTRTPGSPTPAVRAPAERSAAARVPRATRRRRPA